jgi:hypothetical protein
MEYIVLAKSYLGMATPPQKQTRKPPGAKHHDAVLQVKKLEDYLPFVPFTDE